jgi:PAS domain S-box-containing protein
MDSIPFFARRASAAPKPMGPVLVFVAGLCIAAVAALWMHTNVNGDAELRFQHSIEAVTEHVRSRLQLPVYGLQGVRGLYAANQNVDRAKFRAYVESRDMAREFVGVRGFGFIQRVQRPELKTFLATQRSDGAPQFALRQLADQNHDDLYIVKFIEPAADNPGALGLDIGSEANRRATIQRAVDTGEPALTASITLVQDQRKTPGLLLFLPVYATGAHPTSAAQRRAALVGLVDAPVIMSELLDGMPAVRAGMIDFELFDGPASAVSSSRLFDADIHTGDAVTDSSAVFGRRFSRSQTLTIAGRDLTLRVNSTTAFEASVDRTTPWLVLLGGALLSALMARLLHQQAAGRWQAETRALEMTGDLRAEIQAHELTESVRRQAEASSQAYLQELQMQKYALDQHAIMATTDVRGKITYVNNKFCEISGYSHDELLGEDHNLLNSGTHPHGFFKAMYRTISAGKTWHDEVCNRAKGGHLYWVDTTIVPVMNDQGKPERYLAIRADITLRKQVEHDLVQQQLSLERRVQQKTRAAVQSEQHLRLVIDTSLDSIIGMDSDGRVTEWSRQAETTFGWTFAELQGQLLHDFIIPKRYREAHQKGLARYMASGAGTVLGKRIEIFALRRDGTEFPVELALSPIVTPQGTMFSAFVSDVTQRKQEQAALVAAKGLAESASSAKSEFLANMSHEIRTPMNGIIGMVDILQETQLRPEQHRMLGTINQSSMALLQILNDILDFSKIEAGKLEVESVPVHLREVAEGVAQLMVSLPGSHSEVSLFVSPALPAWAFGDPSRLRQVLLNLLGNAIKFSGKPGNVGAEARLSVTSCVLDDGKDGVCFDVVDNGIGMAPEVVGKLFKPFTQADESTARKFGGTGLGLSISQRLVELMGGSISVRSVLGEGSEFSVKLPLRAAPAERATAAEASLAGVQVLLVTGNAFGIQVRKAYCEQAGARVSVAHDMAAARAFLAQSPAATHWVVLVDKTVTGPTADFGLGAGASVVREAPRGTQTYPDDIVLNVRPLLQHDLIQVIAGASGRLNAADTACTDMGRERRDPALRPAAPTAAEAAHAQRLILLAEDNETNRDVMQEQLRLLGYACEMAEDGAIALQMWQANPARYALLLSDCHMPRLDGFGLTEAIRQTEPQGKRLPIIAVTANAMQGEAQRCRERGMDDYLSKPLRMNELRDKLSKWMPQAKVEVRVEDAAVAHAFPIWNPTTLTELVGDNPAMHKRLLEKFVVNARVQVTEITAAAAAGDTSTLAGVAHTLKSAARSVGALRLGELSQRLEAAGRGTDAQACSTLAAGLETAFAAAATEINGHLSL